MIYQPIWFLVLFQSHATTPWHHIYVKYWKYQAPGTHLTFEILYVMCSCRLFKMMLVLEWVMTTVWYIKLSHPPLGGAKICWYIQIYTLALSLWAFSSWSEVSQSCYHSCRPLQRGHTGGGSAGKRWSLRLTTWAVHTHRAHCRQVAICNNNFGICSIFSACLEKIWQENTLRTYSTYLPVVSKRRETDEYTHTHTEAQGKPLPTDDHTRRWPF